MALSDYLTDDEWNGAFYLFKGPSGVTDLGDAMRKMIAVLLGNGYVFKGLDENGQKKEQIPSTNPIKLVKLCVTPDDASPHLALETLKIGRAFIKTHAPTMVLESDEDWNKSMVDVQKYMDSIAPGQWHEDKAHSWLSSFSEKLGKSIMGTALEENMKAKATLGTVLNALFSERVFPTEESFRDFVTMCLEFRPDDLDSAVKEIRG